MGDPLSLLAGKLEAVRLGTAAILPCPQIWFLTLPDAHGLPRGAPTRSKAILRTSAARHRLRRDEELNREVGKRAGRVLCCWQGLVVSADLLRDVGVGCPQCPRKPGQSSWASFPGSTSRNLGPIRASRAGTQAPGDSSTGHPSPRGPRRRHSPAVTWLGSQRSGQTGRSGIWNAQCAGLTGSCALRHEEAPPA